MADDLGVVYTDRKLSQLEKKIHQVYSEAQKDIEKKLNTFLEKSAAREKLYLQRVAEGKMTQEAFDKWKAGQVFVGQNWKSQQENIAHVLSNANQVATQMINGEKADVFCFNGNYTAYDMEHGFGVNLGFDLYDEKSVERLLKDNPQMLPKPRIDIPKDERWNMKNIRNQITQGIIQGESIPKIAKRLYDTVPGMNERQSYLHARTAMTGAQNGGRQARYAEAEEMGIKFKKVWLATLDGRTRDSHRDADGLKAKPEEKFSVGSSKMMYPGDPSGRPEDVYNCRCTMVTELDDYPHTYDRRGKNMIGEYEIEPEMTYREWEKAKWSVQPSTSTALQPDQSGVMSGVKKTGRTSVVEIAKDVNKHFGEGREWSQNCANCAVAAEARFRGYDVTALPRDFSKDNKIPNFNYADSRGRGYWTDCFDGVKNETISDVWRRPKIAEAVERKMKDWGDGSRAVIFVQWDSSKVGHYFNVVNQGGEIIYFDPQSGAVGDRVRDYFMRSVPSKNRIFRVDDKELTDYVRKVVDING